ncbi:serine protease inhibitor 42Dd-like isoform X2 [Tribolium madens]|uniref:serine protease inhibitor 42Dd-like isoform X2 n=1 Tax=Tribolium madens TaxID=41895 RepID=UPI001CF746E3|nr:serine protease inhibitor 42Dd-like isoform X2 [Tribolium madens]
MLKFFCFCQDPVKVRFKVAFQEFVSGNNLFTADVYSLLKTSENLIISPFAIQLVVAFAASGARSKTAQEMATALHLPYHPRDTETAWKTLLPTLTQPDHFHLNLVTKMYLQRNLNLKKDFRTTGKKVFQADIEFVNFASAAEAVKSINEGVRKQTGEKINTWVDDENLLTRDMKMVLLSAAFFKSGWLKPFQFRGSQDFYKSATDVIKVEMMETIGQFNYFESDSMGAKLIELRFVEESLAMIIVLPDKTKVSSDISLIEAHLYEVYLANSFAPELVKVTLPKFKIESLIDFKPILQYLGMAKAFNGDAELEGIFHNKGEAFIDLILQKCVINVNEMGLEMDSSDNNKSSVNSIPPNVKKFFTADRPFMFFIKSKDLVILTGKVVTPVT